MGAKWIVALLLGLALTASAREVRITILHTADLNGHLVPLRDVRQKDGMGGLLRCATAIRGVTNQAGNVLLFDCGNAIGNSVESTATAGRALVRAMEWLGYDACVVGQADWGLGGDALAQLLGMTSVPFLSANMLTPAGAQKRLTRVQPFASFDVDGVRVVAVGLTSPAVSLWHPPAILGETQFKDSIEALKETMTLVRQQRPDVLVLLANQGLTVFDDRANQVQAIAQQFPEFDIILGGHTGSTVEQRWLKQVLYAQSGSDGMAVGRVDLVYDTVRRCVAAKAGSLIEVRDVLAEDAELAAFLKEELEAADRFGSRILAQAARRMPAVPAAAGERAVTDLVAGAIRERLRVDAVLHAAGTWEGLPAGPVRVRDVWRVVPQAAALGVVQLTPGELTEILEENTRQFDTPYFLRLHGLDYVLRVREPKGERVRDLRATDGARLHPRKRLRVAMDSFVLSSGGGRFPGLRAIAERPTSRLELTGVDTRQALVEYLQKKGDL